MPPERTNPVRAPRDTAELICSYDLRGNLIEVNEALDRILGYPRQELLGMALSDILDPESWESARLAMLQHIGGANPDIRQLGMKSKDGRVIPVEMATRLVFEKGAPVAVQAFGRDLGISGLHALRDVEQQLSTTATELARFTEHLKHLHRLSTAHYESLNQVFADYLKTGSEVFQLALGMVFQVDGGTGVVRAMHGYSARLYPNARLDLSRTRFSSIADRLRTRAYCQSSEDPSLDPEFQICIATPILVDAELYGTLSFSSPSSGVPRSFSSEEKELIELMASGIGRTIFEDSIQSERKAAEGRERRRNRVLEMVAENRPLPETLSELARLVDSQSPGALCSVLLLEGGALLCQAAPGLPDGFAAAVDERRIGLTPGEKYEFARVFGLAFAAAAPIFSGMGMPLGAVVLLQREDGPNAHVPGDVLRMATRMAGIAIEQKQLTDRLAYQAQHDFLTGLPNRFRLLELLDERLARAAHSGSEAGLAAVLFVDLDRFKQINDTLGHSIGDRLLIEVAERLKSCLTCADDVAARMGGDEFTVILAHPADEAAAFQTSRQFLDALRAPYLIDGRELFVTASIGMSFYPQHGQDASTLLRTADAAMYRAKNEGKNAIECYVADTQQGAMERLELETALRRALEKSEFELFFQPIVSMSGELDGLEVLLAWNHATLGRISPQRFIPMAEETGLIVPIGSWVLREACSRGAEWIGRGLPLKRIAVNVSALQFARPNFVETVASVLAGTGLPANLLELELTESLVLRDIGESIHRMAQLQELGVSMAIDDFGTGYSSLNYLRRLPVDELKIDQSFLRDLRAPSGTLTVIQTIVSLAHKMGLSVVAEGVETLDELELLRAAGCDKVQGHLYGPSLCASEARALLARTDRRVPVKPVAEQS